MGRSELQDPINPAGLIEGLRGKAFRGSTFKEIPFGIG
jgi:hypothetical protein